MSAGWLIFLGPSLPRAEASALVSGTFVPPIRRGDLPRYLADGWRDIAIIDGEFGQSLSVSLTEIRAALAAGARVWGASSMGALRAAEAGPLGMLGVGWIHHAYARGDIESDAEVALLFDPVSGHAVTEPLVNVRWTLQRARARQLCTQAEADAIFAAAGRIHFAERTWADIARCAGHLAAVERVLALVASDPSACDRKRLDAIELLERIAETPAARPARREMPRFGTFPTRVPPPAAAFLEDTETTRKTPGTHRQLPVADALAIAERDARAMGMSRLAEVGELDVLGLHVYQSIRPTAEEHDNTVCGGKGFSADQARLSALVEAVERSCMSARDRELSFGTLREMREGRLVLNPRALILDNACTWREDEPLHWWPMRDVVSDEEVWIHAPAVFMPFPRGPRLHVMTTTGLAAGASRAEALLYGLLELIEREALTISDFVRCGRPVVLETIPCQRTRALVETLREQGIAVQLWLLAAEIAVPTFYAVLEDVSRRDHALINCGIACHLDPVEGVRAALLEAAVTRLTVIAGAREDLHEQLEAAAGRDYDEIRREALRWRVAAPGPLHVGELPDLSTTSIRGDLDMTLAAVRAAGLPRILACDLSSAEIALRVVRCVVPGMEYTRDHRRIGPRLARAVRALREPASATSRRVSAPTHRPDRTASPDAPTNP